MRGSTTKQQRFLPYRYERFGLRVEPRACVLDETRPVSVFDHEHCVVNLVEYRFAVADLTLELEVPQLLIEEVFPEGERECPPGRLVLVVRCPSSRVRRAHLVFDGPLRQRQHAATIRIQRNELYGAAELAPLLLRGAPGEATSMGYASSAGARVAGARPWEIRTDLLRPPGGQYLDVKYESFSRFGAPQFPWPDNLYQLDCDTSAPTLWLNLDHEHVAEILDSKGTVGTRARMREVFFDHISHAVWTRLFLKAAHDVLEADEPPFDWEDAVLDQFLPLIYVDHTTRMSRVEALRDDFSEGDVNAVLERLDAALQRRHEVAKHMTKLVEDGARATESRD